ncbi:hypothetical protein BJ875DRAFT_52425 [Amylocarpus encephaloides]|uniref:Transcription factor domain-containing protein n=1 Tax=Amylocarpus encephaloides TaxID=45428 RepID=A0A9P7YGV1_9HELO|nr:hypothetical protein BJ875DRAFT_52425 [Amylocarpus encephaloides]
MMGSEVVFRLGTHLNEDVGLYRYGVKVPGPWERGRPKGATKKGTKQDGPSRRQNPPEFRFVNVSKQARDIDGTSRALIRRHVKLKRNLQEVHRDVSLPHQLDLRSQEATHIDEEAENIEDVSLRVLPQINLAQIQGVDPFNRSPIKLEPYMHDLLLYYSTTAWRQFYSIERLAGWNPVVEVWLPLAFKDPALIHTLIACSDSYVSGAMTATYGLRHLYAAISIVNDRLATQRDLHASGTLTTIATIALLEKVAGRDENWRIHMRGLRKLVDLRGGIECLCVEPLVLHKIYRADLYGSLDAIQPPFFNKPCPSLPGLGLEARFASEGLNAIHDAIHLDETLRSCVHQLEEAMRLWTETATPKHAARTRYLLTNVQYTLTAANFRQTSGYEGIWEAQLLEFCRIALILYSLSILDEHATSSTFGQQIGRTFRHVLTDLACSPADDNATLSASTTWRLPLPTDFHLWAIFLVARVARNTFYDTGDDTKEWLLASFTELASPEHGHIQDWLDLQGRLRRFLWVSSIHDPTSQWLWSEVERRRRDALVARLAAPGMRGVDS